MGSFTTVPASSIVPYDNDISGLSANNVKQAIDELAIGSIWTKHLVNLPAGVSTVVSSTPVASFNTGQFIMDFTTITNSKKKLSLDVLKNNSDTQDSVYSIIGSIININISTRILSGNVEVVCLNNEADDVTLSLAKLIL